MSTELIIAISIAIIGWIVALYSRAKNVASAASVDTERRLREAEGKLLAMEVKITPLWAKVQRTISEDLHHPHEKDEEMDMLLEELENLTISQAGRSRLKVLLHERSIDMSETVTDQERASAFIMETVMDKVLEEEKSIIAPNVELVSTQPKGEVITELKEEKEVS